MSKLMEGRMPEKSVASPARKGTPSMKTTIPAGIISALHIQAGDTIEWSIDQESGEFIGKVRRLKKE